MAVTQTKLIVFVRTINSAKPKKLFKLFNYMDNSFSRMK